MALGAIGVHVELEAVRRQIGKGGDELIPVFVPWWKAKHVKEPMEALRKHIFEHDYLPRVKPFSAGTRLHAAAAGCGHPAFRWLRRRAKRT